MNELLKKLFNYENIFAFCTFASYNPSAQPDDATPSRLHPPLPLHCARLLLFRMLLHLKELPLSYS